jgi:hypothetical protein
VNTQSDYKIGDIILRGKEEWRIVRVVKSRSLIEDSNEVSLNTCYVLEEHYLELRNSEGKVEFETLGVLNIPYEGEVSHIKGLAPVIYGGK